jgi:hypothetical protein
MRGCNPFRAGVQTACITTILNLVEGELVFRPKDQRPCGPPDGVRFPGHFIQGID